MDIKELVHKSSPTNTFSEARWLCDNDNFGYLGIPVENKTDREAREILCRLQGTPHIPVIENIGTMDGYVWYKIEYLESFYEVYPTNYNPLHKLYKIEGERDYCYTRLKEIDNQVSSIDKTLDLIVKEIEATNPYGFTWDFHDENVRIREDGTIILTDVLC